MKVKNMTGRTGRAVANQFIITEKRKIRYEKEYGYEPECKTITTTYFQSYSTIIARIEDGQVALDKTYWDYSTTTGKYRNQFLGETKRETEAKIKSGEYVLTDLN